ncbi:MAG: alkaline phosphatase family protein [Clostridiales bacterium]|nr:alkaline phosphatase family protein [Clostridiales bacterium]
MKVSHVIVIGVDGAGTFFRQADTPNLDRIFAHGAVSYDVITSNPTISGECWGSMLTGVVPEMHGLTNGRVSSTPYPTDSIFPTVFRVIREAMPDAELASFCNWNPINFGIIEDNLGVTKGTGNDAAVTEQVCAYVAEHDPAFVFVQFDEVDGAGHGNGYGTEGHLRQIAISDGLIEKMWEAYEARGWLDDTLFIVTADHGGFGHGHGGWTDGEKYIMFAATGPGVKEGTIGEMGVRDTASVVLYALGLADRQPASWTARTPSGLFEGVEAGERPVFEIPYAYAYRTREPGVTPTGDAALSAVIGRDRVAAYLPFDGDATDENGKTATATIGKIYYIDGYNGTGIRLDDGYVSLPWTPGKKSFSLAFWLKSDGVTADPAIFSDKVWSSGQNPGFVVALKNTEIHVNVGNGQDRMDRSFRLPLDFAGGWVHVALTVDREAEEIRCAFDFRKPACAKITDKFLGADLGSGAQTRIGQDATGKYAPLSAVLDDFLLVDGALTEDDIARMKEFYGA